MMGAHVLRAGVNRHIIDLVERGFIDHIAMNGAGAIHDYELARIGATTESVARYIRTGEFGLWRETGELNDWIAEAARAGTGPGRKRRPAHRAERLSAPRSQRAGRGLPAVRCRSPCTWASATTSCTSIRTATARRSGAASYRDFLIFARTVERLEGGVLLSFGSAIMAPEVYLKALAMARNVAHQEGRADPRLRHRRLRSGAHPGRYPQRAAQDRSRLLFPAAQDHPGAHRGRRRRELLLLRRPSRHLPALRRAILEHA